MENTDRENHKFKILIFDASVLIPIPILGLVKTYEFLIFTLIWTVFCGIAGFYNYSFIDILRRVWAVRTSKSHARLKNDRHM